jgi:hypothetical protein
VEFRIFMRDKLRSFDILAFDVVKKQGFDSELSSAIWTTGASIPTFSIDKAQLQGQQQKRAA